MASRLETNFKRLLSRCEVMAADNRNGNWRLEKYISALQDQLAELRQSPSKPSQEVMGSYTRKVEFLHGLIEAEKKPTATEKAMATQLLPPGVISANDTSPQTKELHHQAKSRYQTEMRDELLGTKDEKTSDTGVRLRKTDTEEDLDTLLQHHNRMQEHLAEEMVYLARGLKENARTAGRMVQEDNKKLTDSSKLADTNYSKLEVESKRLEAHTKKSCNWWIWIMLVAVCITFIWMIIFMKMFPKR